MTWLERKVKKQAEEISIKKEEVKIPQFVRKVEKLIEEALNQITARKEWINKDELEIAVLALWTARWALLGCFVEALKCFEILEIKLKEAITKSGG